MMMRPVGVGRTSRGPMGVDGLTMTAGRRSRSHHAFDEALGGDLAALVGADRLVLCQRARLVGRAAIVSQLERRNARGVDDPLDAGIARGGHHDPRAIDVGAHDLVRVGRPQAVVGRDMKDIARALHGGGNGLGVAHVPFDDLELQPVEVHAGAARAHERAHAIARADQRPRHGRAHEARRTSDEREILAGHGVRAFLARDASQVGFSCA